MLLDRLTPEQLDLIPVVFEEWGDRARTPCRLDSVEVGRGVAWLYAQAGLGAPRVVCAQGPLEAEAALAPEGAAPEALKREMIRASLGSQLHRQAAPSAVARLRGWQRPGPMIQSQCEAYEARSRMFSPELIRLWRCHFGLADCAWWTAEYDYWARIGLTFDRLDGWRDFMLCGISEHLISPQEGLH